MDKARCEIGQRKLKYFNRYHPDTGARIVSAR